MGQEDYIFRYRLDQPDARAMGQDRTSGAVRGILKSLMDVLIPLRGEQEVKIDGFAMLNNKMQAHNLFEKQEISGGELGKDCVISSESRPGNTCGPQKALEKPGPDEASYSSIKNASLYEPRIELIKNLLESALSLVDLESEGKPVKIDGFRLKELNDWVDSSRCDPSEVFEHAGTRCNCDCVFCYNKGAPPSLALHVPARGAAEEYREIKTRIKYFEPEANKSLFPKLGSTCEVLAHPRIIEVLTDLREKTCRTLRFSTNGAALTEKNILKMAGLKPVYLDISLNSATPARRKRLMRDKRPETAINSLPFLKEAGIPYSTVIVPWPVETEQEMLEDLEKTVEYVSQHGVHIVQISMPGFSGLLPVDRPFERERLWKLIVEKVQELRKKVCCPIVVMPGMYEENMCRQLKNIPEVIGVVKNSPADLSGVKPGDVVKRIAGSMVRNRPQARDLLSILQNSGARSVAIGLKRGSNDVSISIDLDNYDYPYSRQTDSHLGFVFMGTGFKTGYLEKLNQIIHKHEAREVLFLTSELVKPSFEQSLRESLYFAGINLVTRIPRNRFFGGNIFMGDLLVVDDFIYCIKSYMNSGNKKPDLVVIPSSPFNLSQWGRDLTGRCYLDIERESGVAVELLECGTIYD